MEDNIKARHINVGGHLYLYDSGFISYPFAYFDIPVNYENELFEVARAIERRCKERFKTAELVGMKIIKRFNDKFEVRVGFAVSDRERIDYQNGDI